MFKEVKNVIFVACLALLLVGCAIDPARQVDYTSFKNSRPHSILVLPPKSKAMEINAGNGVLAQVTYPLAEAGYYVLPVTLVSETFKQNGLTTANDIQAIPYKKLRQIFGADAALYIDIDTYGVRYLVFDSVATVSLSAKLIDLKNGATLWTGSASASSAENNAGNNGGLLSQLITAAIEQVGNKLSDAAYPVANVANQRLLQAGQPNGILYGPRSPKYETD